MTIFGWDCSNWDYDRGPVDVAAAVRDGISFVTAKATEGATFTDASYARTAVKAHGVVPLFGAYHVLHPNSYSTISRQVDHYLSVLDGQSPWWRSGPFLVQLDCERWSADDFPQRADIAAWCDTFVARTGNAWYPIVYASHGQYGDALTGLNRPLWNANYGNDPVAHYGGAYPGDNAPGWAPYSGQTPVLLQYGSQLTIGSQPGCDANAFRGTLGQLRAMAGGPGTPTHETEVLMITGLVPAGFGIDETGAPVAGGLFVPLTFEDVASSAGLLPHRPAVLSLATDFLDPGATVTMRVAFGDGGGQWTVEKATLTSGAPRAWLTVPTGSKQASIVRWKTTAGDTTGQHPVAWTLAYGAPTA
jgi:GH25 family lysozyme M1 (1,4-beta-N-acetylmuramidase)